MEKQDYLQQLQNDIKEITYLENKNRELIHTLENQVQSQVDELRKKDNILIQQSKMAAMGEMISNIAHQWRQPLNVLSTSIINISLKNELNTLNSADLEHCVNQSQKVIQDMSKTIDDFRDFFVPRKEKIEFNVMDIINDSIELISPSLDVNAIKLDINCEEHCYIAGYKNDLKQVILVILNNAKDAIKSKELKDGLMFISSICNKNSLILKFRDNGGGVPDDIKDKIFEPYFTTKHKSQGTGIGLYMVMEIITKHFSGNIEVKNVEYEYNGKAQKGAEFVITIPLKSQ
jgi:signal transduction histidine kinase